MVKRKPLFPWVMFAALCLLGGLIMLFPGYRFSAWVTFGIAGIVLCYQLLRLLAQRYPKTSGIIRRIMTVGICLVLVAAAITGVLIIRAGTASPEAECDYLIVLGAGVNGSVPSLTLRERLEAAQAYLQTHQDTICIVSGGQGPGEDITEAACMSAWLIDHGIDPSRIWQETKATSTQENLSNSLDLIFNTTGSHPETVGILSSEYHLFRAGLMAGDQGLTPILVPAKTRWLSLRINYYLREIAGVWYYMVFGS